MIFVISFATAIPVVAYFFILYFHLPVFFVVNSSWFMLLMLSPVLEEIVFRGLIQDYLLSKTSNVTVSIIVVNLLFMVFHCHINPNYIYLLAIFGCGIMFSILKFKLLRLRYPILYHVYYNLCFYLYCTKFRMILV